MTVFTPKVSSIEAVQIMRKTSLTPDEFADIKDGDNKTYFSDHPDWLIANIRNGKIKPSSYTTGTSTLIKWTVLQTYNPVDALPGDYIIKIPVLTTTYFLSAIDRDTFEKIFKQ